MNDTTRIASVLLFLVVLVGIVVYLSLQNAMYKGEYASSRSELREMRTLADQHFNQHGSYEGFCESETFKTQQSVIEQISRAGLFNTEPYSVRCSSNTDRYAVSMSSYYGLLGEKTPESHVCVSLLSDRVLPQNRHVENPWCDEQGSNY